MVSLFFISRLILFQPEIYNFGDSVKIIIPKKGVIGNLVKDLKENHFYLILDLSEVYPPYSYRIQSDYVLGFEFLQKNDKTVIDFRITNLVEKYRVKKDNTKIEVVFSKRKVSEIKKDTSPPELLRESSFNKTVQKEPKREIKKIVIDPGHGGMDTGAIGKRGIKEKDVNLQVARLLKKMIEEEMGLEVVLTRESDTFISLRERAVIANNENADIFISLHCNASKKITSKGIEVYFLSEAKTDWERAVEALENASLRFELPENKRENILDAILLDLAQTEFLKESQKLAEFLQKNLVPSKDMDRGVKQAGFYVLYGVYMPAVLIEMGFLTNPEEEILLESEKYQKEICKKIIKGLKEFIEWYKR